MLASSPLLALLRYSVLQYSLSKVAVWVELNVVLWRRCEQLSLLARRDTEKQENVSIIKLF